VVVLEVAISTSGLDLIGRVGNVAPVVGRFRFAERAWSEVRVELLSARVVVVEVVAVGLVIAVAVLEVAVLRGRRTSRPEAVVVEVVPND
jgi:hypothetical protein